jgi:predicted hydrocarbon binding protein
MILGPSDHMKELLASMLEKVLIELNERTFEEYIKTVGLVEGMAMMRLYKKRNGYILISIVKNKMGLKGTGIDALVMPMALGQMALNADPRAVKGVFTDKGAAITVENCIFRGASPEFCVTISHFTSDLMCEAIDPDYECIWTHHINRNDPYCRYVFKKKAEHIDLMNPGKTISVLNFPPIPEDDKRFMRNFILTHFWDATTEAFMDLRGSKETLDHLIPVANNLGREMGEALKKSGQTPPQTVDMIGDMFDMLGGIMTQQGTIRPVSQNEFCKDITDCPFQTFPNEVCRQIEALFQGMVHAINPDIEFSYGKMMNAGAPICSWSVRKKGMVPSTDAVEVTVSQSIDSIGILKSRLAKGEISIDEYDKIRKVISET